MSPEEIQQIFFAECEEALVAIEVGLASCKAGTQDSDTVNAVFRAVHSIKGGSGAFGFMALQTYAHAFEALLSDVRDGSVALSEPLIDLMLRGLDVLSDQIEVAREGGTPPDVSHIIAQLQAAQGAGAPDAGPASAVAAPIPEEAAPARQTEAKPNGDQALDGGVADLDSMLDDLVSGFCGDAPVASEPKESTPSWQLHVRPHAAAMANGSEPLLMLRELAALGGRCIVCDTSAVPQLDAFDAEEGYLGWTFELPADVEQARAQEIFEFLGEECSRALGADAAIPPVRLRPRDVEAPSCDVAPAVTKPAVAAQPAPASPADEDEQATPVAAAPAAAQPSPSGAAAPSAPAGAPLAQSIRIDLVKLDRLIDTVGELVIAQAAMTQRLTDCGAAASASEELSLLETLTRDIQESAMSIRAQPIGTVFSRVPRILRELAASTGKQVRLETSGEATELDKTVIERLGEPLTHLIRNAVDHGIESAEERLAAGKEPEGTLVLSAEQRSGRIVIRIADDGKGIDRERVLAKAVERGIVAPDASLAPEEIDALIFAPGFSTAANVTSVSGRGVGMDVVRQNVKDLSGRITIETECGKGTAFILSLPLTLAISDGMIVTVDGERLVVPLAHVVECLQPEPGEVQGLGGRAMINVRGRFIPVLPVREAMGRAGARQARWDGVLIVVDTELAGQVALLVDEISDQRQVVIKSLDTNFRAVAGIAGATVLGDGEVALILDVDGLVRSAGGQVERQAA